MNKKTRQFVQDMFCADRPHAHNTEFYGIIKPKPNGEFALFVYAVNWTKTYGFRITEVNRSWSDRPYYTCKDVWRSMWGGIHVEFDERRNRPELSHSWYNGKWGSKVHWAKSGGVWYAPYIRYANLDALAQTKYRYCGFDHYAGPLSLNEYIEIWRQHKGVELLAKANLDNFVTERYAAKMEKDKGFASFVRNNAKAIAGHYRPQTVVRAYANGWTLDRAWEEERARYLLVRAPKGVDRKALWKYLSNNDIDVEDYYGYCRDVAAANEDILAFGVTFPKDFHKARVRMQKRIKIAQAKKDAERVAALKQLAERINALLGKMSKKLAWRVGDFSVVVPTTREDFIKEGNRMHNCIGGYFASCADGEQLCFFITRNGRSVADVEISPKSGKVLQCRGKFNKAMDAEVEEFAAKVGKSLASMLRRRKAGKAA